MVGVIALFLSPILGLPQYAPLSFPGTNSIAFLLCICLRLSPLGNITVAATKLTETPAGFPFVIEGCGAYTGNLVDVLTKAIAALPPALSDVELGLDSRHGFKALFKDGTTSNFVRGILQSIASAQPLKGLNPYSSVASVPHFACVQPSIMR